VKILPENFIFVTNVILLKVKLLSVTLRDAQHLSWKTFKKFEPSMEKRDTHFGSEINLVRKAEEIAEKLKETKNSDSPQSRIELAKLFSEMLFSLFVLSELQGVSLEDSFLEAVNDRILEYVS